MHTKSIYIHTFERVGPVDVRLPGPQGQVLGRALLHLATPNPEAPAGRPLQQAQADLQHWGVERQARHQDGGKGREEGRPFSDRSEVSWRCHVIEEAGGGTCGEDEVCAALGCLGVVAPSPAVAVLPVCRGGGGLACAQQLQDLAGLARVGAAVGMA